MCSHKDLIAVAYTVAVVGMRLMQKSRRYRFVGAFTLKLLWPIDTYDADETQQWSWVKSASCESIITQSIYTHLLSCCIHLSVEWVRQTCLLPIYHTRRCICCMKLTSGNSRVQKTPSCKINITLWYCVCWARKCRRSSLISNLCTGGWVAATFTKGKPRRSFSSFSIQQRANSSLCEIILLYCLTNSHSLSPFPFFLSLPFPFPFPSLYLPFFSPFPFPFFPFTFLFPSIPLPLSLFLLPSFFPCPRPCVQYLRHHISVTVQDRRMVTIDNG